MKIKNHITNEEGECVRWCYRCKRREDLEKKFKEYLFYDILESYMDLEDKVIELLKEEKK